MTTPSSSNRHRGSAFRGDDELAAVVVLVTVTGAGRAGQGRPPHFTTAHPAPASSSTAAPAPAHLRHQGGGGAASGGGSISRIGFLPETCAAERMNLDCSEDGAWGTINLRKHVGHSIGDPLAAASQVICWPQTGQANLNSLMIVPGEQFHTWRGGTMSFSRMEDGVFAWVARSGAFGLPANHPAVGRKNTED